jgi:hypothetical protein
LRDQVFEQAQKLGALRVVDRTVARAETALRHFLPIEDAVGNEA